MKVRQQFFVFSFLYLVILAAGYFLFNSTALLWTAAVIGPIILLGFYDAFQKTHAIKRNFPVVGNFRYLLEKFRPEIMQYFVETDTQGRPINRIFRSLVYKRAKRANDTTPFGTQLDVYNAGYEWMPHSVYAIHHDKPPEDPRVNVGGPDCLLPYSSSILNISAMSFGSLSDRAILALNKGAKMGNFAHNTGEGAISRYHLKPGGDLIWQIGTGYFGCRTEGGDFCPKYFTKNATQENVKMIEIKVSQGAKPGHGGILPAIKNTEEIAEIRGVKAHTDVMSPPSHSKFSNAEELMDFIKELRDLSGGKPIGFKLCIGKEEEFKDFCKAMIKTNIKPDFITIDGGEGGTGAAPVEFSNSLGMPLRDGLAFAVDCLNEHDLKKDIKVFASGKTFSAFHMARLLALGADGVNSARAMMLAVGCIQALECNNNTCPVGVATQNKNLTKALNVEDKALRVKNFHNRTVEALNELVSAAGLCSPSELKREHIYKRVSTNKILKYSDIYPSSN